MKSVTPDSGYIRPRWRTKESERKLIVPLAGREADTGAENTLAAPRTARALGLEPDPATEIVLGTGGGPRRVRFCDAWLMLHSPIQGSEEFIARRTEIGVIVSQWEPPFPLVLGQTGFFDQFTITVHRGAQTIVIEDWSGSTCAPSL